MVIKSILAAAVIYLALGLVPKSNVLLTSLAVFLTFIAIGAIKPTAAEMAGMGVFLAGFGVLFLCVMK